MSRFDTRGDNRCSDCEFFRKSDRCPADRCDYPDNLSSNWMGTVYMKTPENQNIFNKCKWFKRRNNGS